MKKKSEGEREQRIVMLVDLKQVYLACKFIPREPTQIIIMFGEFVILVSNTACSFDCHQSHRNCSY
jgi:hypothetical protein